MRGFIRLTVPAFLIVVALSVALLISRADPARDRGSDHLEFRYTAEGWLPMSDLVVAPLPTAAGVAERLPPMTVATLQLLASLLALMLFDRRSVSRS